MIFGTDEQNGIPGDPRYDAIMNYTYATIVILAFLISSFLNPALLRYHCSRPSSSLTTLTTLLKILNVLDFLTTTLLCPYLVYGLLSPTLLPHQVAATVWQRVYSAVFAFLLFASVSITTVMSANRAYAIRFPLQVLRKRWAVVYPISGLVSLALLMVGINC